MNTKHIFLPNSIPGIGSRGTTADRRRSRARILATGLALIAWAHSSTPAKAGDLVPQCSGAPFGYPCTDTDLNECTQAACNGAGDCNQNGVLRIGEPCYDWDGDVCTIALCESDFSGSARCDQDHPHPDNPPCPDTDGDECSVPQCDQGVCDQSFFVPLGQECGEPDNDVCTFHYCQRDYDGNGVCVTASLTSCDDNNACTFDLACDPDEGCQSVPILCFDTDGNECTAPQCIPSTGDCDDNAIRRLGESCQDTDGSPCTVARCVDSCAGGDCGAYVACDQLAECTDLTPPEATCPPAAVEVFCLDSTDIGEAPVFVDDCDPDLALDNAVDVIPATDPDDPVLEVIQQSWQATNDCQLVSECEQTITVLKPKFHLDIKPGSCPNVIDTRSRGTIRMSILGTPDFDVSAVDVDSLMLFRADDNGSFIAPASVVSQDAGTPFDGDACGCHRRSGDGLLDLTLKFNNLDVVSALRLNTVPPGASIRLVVYGALSDGCEFTAEDCMFRPAR